MAKKTFNLRVEDQDVTKLKSPRYGGLKEKGMENEFSSISINIKKAEGLTTPGDDDRLTIENFVAD